ncbi:hypothetical protein XENTR_v10016529 [Xenopus tropicalis]|nr:hypothetical protein XENTR_v10016529 [Xenopus tropicalis]
MAAQGMPPPPPLCIPQVYRPESGGADTAQHLRGTSQETTGRDSAITNHTNSAVGQISVSSARSGTGGRAMPRHRLESGVSGPLQCKVWLMGHSFIHWAERRASVRQADGQLGFPVSQVKLQWVSRRGLRWEELVPRAVQEAKDSGPPSVILLHAGGNDLGQCPMKVLISTIRRDC